MDIFAEIIENGERTGLIGYREDLWEKAEGMDKRLVFKLFNEIAELARHHGSDDRRGRCSRRIGARGLPVMTYSINTDDDNYIVYLERSANKWPLLPENFSFFLLDARASRSSTACKRDLINLGGDYTLYDQQRQERRPPRRQGVLDRRQVEGQGARSSTPTAACSRCCKLFSGMHDLQRRQPPPHAAAVAATSGGARSSRRSMRRKPTST